MARFDKNTIHMEVLRVASSEVLGETTPLRVAAPCNFSNAKGDLREVDSYEALAAEGERDGQEFRSIFGIAG